MDAELLGLVADHVADLRRCAALLDPVPQLAKTAAEIRKAADELEAALSVAQGQGFVPRVECQMDWTTIDQHHKKWTCRNCGRTHTRNSADGHPHFPCAAAPAQPDGVRK